MASFGLLGFAGEPRNRIAVSSIGVPTLGGSSCFSPGSEMSEPRFSHLDPLGSDRNRRHRFATEATSYPSAPVSATPGKVCMPVRFFSALQPIMALRRYPQPACLRPLTQEFER